jgi:hypothetical protein
MKIHWAAVLVTVDNVEALASLVQDDPVARGANQSVHVELDTVH